MKINASICSLFTLLTDGFESAYYIEPSQELCHASVFTLGWSNIFLLFNTLLALIDCWLEMTKPKFYAENVTPMFLVVLSSILNAMLIFLLDWVYIFGVEPVRCALPHHLVSTFILLHWFCYFHLRQDEIGCFSRWFNRRRGSWYEDENEISTPIPLQSHFISYPSRSDINCCQSTGIYLYAILPTRQRHLQYLNSNCDLW